MVVEFYDMYAAFGTLQRVISFTQKNENPKPNQGISSSRT
jgi:hypothetical protein